MLQEKLDALQGDGRKKEGVNQPFLYHCWETGQVVKHEFNLLEHLDSNSGFQEAHQQDMKAATSPSGFRHREIGCLHTWRVHS